MPFVAPLPTFELKIKICGMVECKGTQCPNKKLFFLFFQRDCKDRTRKYNEKFFIPLVKKKKIIFGTTVNVGMRVFPSLFHGFLEILTCLSSVNSTPLKSLGKHLYVATKENAHWFECASRCVDNLKFRGTLLFISV